LVWKQYLKFPEQKFSVNGALLIDGDGTKGRYKALRLLLDQSIGSPQIFSEPELVFTCTSHISEAQFICLLHQINP
jgi:hypothetical protein